MNHLINRILILLGLKKKEMAQPEVYCCPCCGMPSRWGSVGVPQVDDTRNLQSYCDYCQKIFNLKWNISPSERGNAVETLDWVNEQLKSGKSINDITRDSLRESVRQHLKDLGEIE